MLQNHGGRLVSLYQAMAAGWLHPTKLWQQAGCTLPNYGSRLVALYQVMAAGWLHSTKPSSTLVALYQTMVAARLV